MLQNPLIDAPAEASPEELAARRAAALAPVGPKRDLPAEISPLALKARQAVEERIASRPKPQAPTEEMPAAGRFAGAAGGSIIGAMGGGDAAAAVSLLSKAAKRAAVAHHINNSSQGKFLTEAMDVVGEAAQDWAKGALAVKDFLLPPEKQKGDLAERAGGFVGGLVGLGAMGDRFGSLALGSTGAGQAAAPIYYETLAKTGDEEKAIQAALPALGVGATYALPAGKLLAKAGSGAFGKMLLSAGAEGALGGAQGAALTKIEENATGEDLDEARRGIEDAGWGFLTTLGLDLLLRGKAKLSGKLAHGKATPGEAEVVQLGEEAAGAATPEPQPIQETTPGSTTPQTAPAEGATGTPSAETTTPPGTEVVASSVAPLEEAAAGGASPEVQPAPTKPPAAEGTIPETEAKAPTEPSKATGIKNATVEKELKDMGLELPEKDERKPFVELHAKAKEKFDKSKGEAGRELVEDLEQNMRAPTDDESALLTFESNRLIQERDAAEAAHEKSPTKANKERVEAAKAAYARAAGVFERAGKESGRALNARKMMLAHDYSLAEMERRLPSVDPAEVKKMHADIEATQLAHEKYVTEAELKRAELEAEDAMLRLKKEAKGGTRRAKRAEEIAQTKKELNDILEEIGRRSRLKAGAGFGAAEFGLLAQAAGKAIKLGAKSFAQWADEMVARFGEDIRPHLRGAWDAGHGQSLREMAEPLKGKTPEQIHKGVQKIALNLVESGVTDRNELAKAVHAILQDVDPNITLEQARDAISGYGQYRQLTGSEARRKLRDLKGQMQQVSKLEALQKKEAIKKTGFERQPPSAEQKRLAKQVSDLKKKLGVDTVDRLKALKTRLTNQIGEFERRIKEKDFAQRPKPKPVTLDPEAIKLKAQEISAKRRYEVAKEKEERAQRGAGQKAVDLARESWDALRTFVSSFDFSAVRKQGGFFTSGHPFKSIGHAKKMFEAFGSARVAAEVDAEIKSRPTYDRNAAAGLELTSTDGVLLPGEEALRSNFAEKFPGVKASNRAYVTYLNLQRSIHLDAMADSLGHTPTKDEMEALAAFVNIATGRATGKGKQIASRLEGIRQFWAPSYVVSRFQLAGEPIRLLLPGGKGRTFAVRKAIAKELVRYVAGQSAYYALLGATASVIADELGEKFSIGTDPRSSDFGKIRIGNVRVDPLSGMAQVVTAVTRLVTGERVTAGGKVEKTNRLKELGRFARSKLGPIQGRIADALAEETFTGKKVTPTEALTQPPIPLSLNDTYRALKELGVPAGTILSLLSLIGDSVQVYEDKKK